VIALGVVAVGLGFAAVGVGISTTVPSSLNL